MHTTLNAIRAHSPCQDGWTKLLAHLGKTKADDEPLRISTILESNGLDDALWCLRALPAEYDNAVRLLVCDLVEPALQFAAHGDDRPRAAVETARRFARGEATAEELAAASAAADAAYAAAEAAAYAAAKVAANTAADAVAYAAEAAEAAARESAEAAAVRFAADAAADFAYHAQEQNFRAWLARMEADEHAPA